MLGDVGCGAAIFTAEREALAQPQRHQEDRRQPADRGVGRQQSDQEGRGAHHHDGDQEGIFAPPGEFVYFWAVASPNCAVTLIAAYQSVCSTRAPERAPQTLLAAVHLRL